MRVRCHGSADRHHECSHKVQLWILSRVSGSDTGSFTTPGRVNNISHPSLLCLQSRVGQSEEGSTWTKGRAAAALLGKSSRGELATKHEPLWKVARSKLVRDRQTSGLPNHHLHTVPVATFLFYLDPTALPSRFPAHPHLRTSQWSTERSSQSPSTISSRLVSNRHAPDQHVRRPSLMSIQGRQKRKNEQLAQDIFGKNRRQSAPAAGNTKKAPIGGSLASRVGVTKVYFAHYQKDLRSRLLTPKSAQHRSLARTARHRAMAVALPDLRSQATTATELPMYPPNWHPSRERTTQEGMRPRTEALAAVSA